MVRCSRFCTKKSKKKIQKSIKIAKKGQKGPKEQKVPKNAAFLDFFGIFFKRYKNCLCHSDSVQQTKNLFVTVTQCDKQTNNLCNSESVRQTILTKISYFFVPCDNKIGEKT